VSYHPIFNHDFNKYNKQVIKLKSKQFNIQKLMVSFTVLTVSIIFFFMLDISNSSATQNLSQEPHAHIKEALSLPIPSSTNTSLLNNIPEIEITKTSTHSASIKPEKSHTITTGKSTTGKNAAEKSAQASKLKLKTPLVKPLAISAVTNKTELVYYTVKSGDNLASIFKKNKLSKKLLHTIIYSTEHGKQLARIRPGQKIVFTYNNRHKLQGIALQKNKVETLVISSVSTLTTNSSSKDKKVTLTKFTSTIELKDIEIRQKFVNVVINDSLFLSATKAGLSERFTMELANLFGWDIDFALEIRKGDSFSLLFNEHFVDGKKIANGQILVAEFINQGKSYETIYFTDQSGKSDYYSADGYSKHRAFLRTPVAFSRISSRFSKSRKHPVLKRTRAHKGVDYAAPRGTPIKSSGDGVVTYRGRMGGYGNVIQIQHGSKYKTVYGHMSSFNRKIKKGSHVKQGQIIGYVGSTGLATGPHLHYEFRVNGVHRNPLTVKLPKANPLDKKYLQSFYAHSETMISSLKLKKHDQIALLKK
jgi:murein DD-endopeptidase MepM/ murein hydrolase activator NlpD